MIQFNLLPDVKLKYIKAQRTKYMVATISVIASGVSLGILVLLVLTVNVWQGKTISDLSKDISAKSKDLKDTPDLNKILTIQGQLGSLGQLHADKAATQRLFGYLAQLTPAKATITDITIDFAENTATVTGKAPSLDVVNTFADSLKFTKYVAGSSEEQKDAFSSVVLSGFGKDENGATYSLTFSFDHLIFDNANTVRLVVPKTTTTRSVVEQPDALFNGTTTEIQEQQ